MKTREKQEVVFAGSGLIPFSDPNSLFKDELGLTRELSGFKGPDDSVVIPAKFHSVARRFSEGVAWAFTMDGDAVYLNPDGSIAFRVPKGYGNMQNFSNGRARVSARSSSGRMRMGFIDLQGNVVVPAQYRNADPFFVGEYTRVRAPTWLASHLERFVRRTGIDLPGTDCLVNRVFIIDRSGNRVSAASLP
jgi:hypothetical protein